MVIKIEKLNTKIKIENKIPPPANGIYKYLFKKMKIGDSFLYKKPSITSITHYFAKPRNKKFVSRSVKGGYRVWRVSTKLYGRIGESSYDKSYRDLKVGEKVLAYNVNEVMSIRVYAKRVKRKYEFKNLTEAYLVTRVK